jgi:hypothetical protein
MALIGMAFFALLSFVLLVILYWNNERKRRARQMQQRADMADLSILFQTIRDVVSQQKALAKEFNQELDKKMHLVKQVLVRGVEKNERLHERQQLLSQALEDAQARLESLQRQIGFLREAVEASVERLGRVEAMTPPAAHSIPSTPPPIPSRPPIAPEASTPPRAPREEPPRSPAPVLRPREEREPLFAVPENSPAISSTAFSEWDSPEFPADITEAAPVPTVSPPAPGDADAARREFRAILDLDVEPAARPGEPAFVHAPPPDPARRSAESGNGSRGMAPLQKRVAEYSQAGMTVAEIARELGIGKGEVRLMLSLAKQPAR